MANKSLFENTDYRSFNVILVGAESQDEVSLNRLLKITHYRARRYQLTSIATDMDMDQARKLISDADIIIVNVNNPEAIFIWSRLASRIPAHKRKPVIRITREKRPKSAPNLTISWPINPTRVIQILDRYTIDHLNFIPEFEIGGDAPAAENVVVLPRHTRQPSPSDKSPTSSDLPALSRRKPPLTQCFYKALIADDSLAVRRQLELEFTRLGCDLKTVSDGDSALHAAQTEYYDIIFLDVIMPGMDGYSVCKGIRRNSKNRHTPVILLTSKSSRFDKLKGKMSGCDTYLTKPINHNEFCSVTEQHLKAPTGLDIS